MNLLEAIKKSEACKTEIYLNCDDYCGAFRKNAMGCYTLTPNVILSDKWEIMTFDGKLQSDYYTENNAEFYNDVLTKLGLINHPKAGKAFQIAWDNHANGYRDVYHNLSKLADLLLG